MNLLPETTKGLILDMDGVLWRGDAPIGDLAATFRRIAERGLRVVFATNNSIRTPQQYVERLHAFGQLSHLQRLQWVEQCSSFVRLAQAAKRAQEQPSAGH